jgi:hypothetical protein
MTQVQCNELFQLALLVHCQWLHVHYCEVTYLDNHPVEEKISALQRASGMVNSEPVYRDIPHMNLVILDHVQPNVIKMFGQITWKISGR